MLTVDRTWTLEAVSHTLHRSSWTMTVRYINSTVGSGKLKNGNNLGLNKFDENQLWFVRQIFLSYGSYCV